MNPFNAETAHGYLLRHAPLKLAFDPARDFELWRKDVDTKLRELLGDTPPRVAPNVRIEFEKEHDDFIEKRFVFTAEEYDEGGQSIRSDVPCHLLLPKTGDGPFPVVITLQGHSSGMHISLGRTVYEGDDAMFTGDRDFCISAVKEGYAAIAMEQRAFGERKKDSEFASHGCHHPTMVSLLLGRTMIGERSWDVSRCIDAMEAFPELDLTRIGCMGNSGGGTITYFASCLDSRISAAMPSCYVCTFADSIGSLYHCADNYVPGIMNWFEMGDLVCLIAPRPIVVVAGKDDEIFPLPAVKKTFARISEIYAAAGAPENCRLVVGSEGHRFYAAQSWPVFRKLTNW
jgi:dienelactone hydrolase